MEFEGTEENVSITGEMPEDITTNSTEDYQEPTETEPVETVETPKTEPVEPVVPQYTPEQITGYAQKADTLDQLVQAARSGDPTAIEAVNNYLYGGNPQAAQPEPEPAVDFTKDWGDELGNPLNQFQTQLNQVTQTLQAMQQQQQAQQQQGLVSTDNRILGAITEKTGLTQSETQQAISEYLNSMGLSTEHIPTDPQKRANFAYTAVQVVAGKKIQNNLAAKKANSDRQIVNKQKPASGVLRANNRASTNTSGGMPKFNNFAEAYAYTKANHKG